MVGNSVARHLFFSAAAVLAQRNGTPGDTIAERGTWIVPNVTYRAAEKRQCNPSARRGSDAASTRAVK